MSELDIAVAKFKSVYAMSQLHATIAPPPAESDEERESRRKANLRIRVALATNRLTPKLAK